MRKNRTSLSQFGSVPDFTRIGALILILPAYLISTGLAQAQRPPHNTKRIPSLHGTPGPSQIPLPQGAHAPSRSATASKNIVSIPCPPAGSFQADLTVSGVEPQAEPCTSTECFKLPDLWANSRSPACSAANRWQLSYRKGKCGKLGEAS
jgi:hypothetical protein